jgi:predicted XRE-type DNA-binding protein
MIMKNLNKHEVRICKLCGSEFRFNAIPSKVLAGHGFFCSRICQQRGRKTQTLAARFAKHIGETTTTGCVLWSGGTNGAGYGSLGGPLAHRIAYELFVGPIPEGVHVLHRCDTPLCVNHAHLFLGTNNDNIADKLAKSRQAKGEMFNRALTESDISEIRSRFGQETQTQLAKAFGVTQSNISRIVRGLIWKHAR